MKKLLIALTVAFSLAACNENNNELQNSKQNEIMEKQDKQLIEQLLSTYKTSLNSSDATLSTSLYTKDGQFMPSEAPTAIGSENILKSYEFVFSQIQLNIEFFIEEIEVEGDFAFATTSSKGSVLIHATGDELNEANRELFVFEKVDGMWKIARYMFNKTEPKQ